MSIQSPARATDGHTARTDPRPDAGRRPGVATVVREYGIVGAAVALFALLSVQTTNFLSLTNLRNIVDQQAPILLVAAFVTLALIAGCLDVSVAAVYVLAPLVALTVENAGAGPGAVVLAGLGTGLACGAVNAVVVTRLRIPAFIGTLATSFVFFGLGYVVSDASILRPVDLSIRDVAAQPFLGLTTFAWLSIVAVAIAALLLTGTRFGRQLYAVGGNEEAARLAGVRVGRVRTLALLLTGAAAGVAGTLNALRTLTAQATDDVTLVFTVIAAVVVGGTSIAGGAGTVWRTVVGVLFLAMLVNGFNLNGVDPVYQRIVQGLVILLAVGVDSWSRERRAA